MSFRKTLPFALVALIFSSPLPAQDDGGEVDIVLTDREKAELEKLPPIPAYQKRQPGETAFAVVSPAKSKEDIYYLRNGKAEKIEQNTGTIRRFQFGMFPDGIVFYRYVADAEGGQKLSAVGKATKGDSKDGIVVFSPPAEKDGEEDKSVLTMPFIDLSKSSFSPGQVRMLNLTPLALLARMDDKPAKVPPMDSLTRTPKQSNGLFPLQVAISTEGKAKMIYSNTFQIEKNMRILFLIVPDRANANASSPARCMVYKDKGSVTQ